MRVVIDCDPGRDDALAILAASGAPGIRVDFISTVAGNVSLDSAAANALRVLAVAGISDTPVYEGACKPLDRDRFIGSALHGDMSDNGLPLPEPLNPIAGPAHDVLAAWCREEMSETKRLIAIGPLTNVGRLLREDRDALRGVDAMYVMGGTLSHMKTRVSDTAEFNFFVDPEAAALVLQSGVEVRLYDYDVTTSCQIPVDGANEIGQRIGGNIGAYVTDWLGQLYEYANKVYGRSGVAVHDLYAAAGAAGVEPQRWEQHHLRVDCTERGRGTVIRESGSRPHYLARGLDVEEIIEFLVDALRRLPDR